MPACAANGDSAAAIPFREITIDRVCERSCATAVIGAFQIPVLSISIVPTQEIRPTFRCLLYVLFPSFRFAVHSILRTIRLQVYAETVLQSAPHQTPFLS